MLIAATAIQHNLTQVTRNEPIMERYAHIRAFLRRRGEVIADFDSLLAATAQYYNLTILTYNIRHFQRIPDVGYE